VDSLPLDTDTITDTITMVQLMGLGTSPRADIDARTNELIGHLRELLTEPIWEGDEPAIQLFRQAYRLLELSRRPSVDTSAFAAYAYMRELAISATDLLKVYVEKNGPTS
jgi:hypothetical protein